MALVLQGHSLLSRLRSLKHTFLLEQGDYLVFFLDTASDELSRPAQDVSVAKLQAQLELALKSSIAASNPHNDDVFCCLEKKAIIAQLLSIYNVDSDAPARVEAEERPITGMETFTLDYNVTYPVSLVISRKSLVKYKLLFRHMFHFRHVERQLCDAWQLHQLTRRALAPSGSLGRAYCLCQRMLHFLQNFLYYMTVEVVEPNWIALEDAVRGKTDEAHGENTTEGRASRTPAAPQRALLARSHASRADLPHSADPQLRAATTLDQVIDYHDRFLDACMKEGMLFWCGGVAEYQLSGGREKQPAGRASCAQGRPRDCSRRTPGDARAT